MLERKTIDILSNSNELIDVCYALSNPLRIEILKLLNFKSMPVQDLSKAINAPLSSTLLHVNVLKDAGLITIEQQITKTGKQKLCSRTADEVDLFLYKPHTEIINKSTIEIPIGSYTNYDIPYKSGCGIATKDKTIGADFDCDVFFSPERFKAGYIWFSRGTIEYRVPKLKIQKFTKISISFEVCSEAPFYRNDWKSDITLWLCNIEIGTYTSLGDFGGRRGKNNPKWWSNDLTQYGVLTTWEICEDGTYVNNVRISDVSIKDIPFEQFEFIPIRLGNKEDAKHIGGVSLFGSSFGDYDQEIIVTFYWE